MYSATLKSSTPEMTEKLEPQPVQTHSLTHGQVPVIGDIQKLVQTDMSTASTSNDADAQIEHVDPPVPFEDQTLAAIDQAVRQTIIDADASAAALELIAQAKEAAPGYSPEEVTRLVRQTLRSTCHASLKAAVMSLPKFDMQAAVKTDGKRMMLAAAQCKDGHALVQKLITMRAPYVPAPPQATQQTRRVLLVELAICKLYPTPLSPDASPLDVALEARNFEEACRLLNEAREGRTDAELWQHSFGTSGQGGRPDREDVRKALLVLGDYTQGPGSLSSVIHKDGFKTSSPTIRNHLKSLPYYSPNRKVITVDPAYQRNDPAFEQMVKQFGGVPIDNNNRARFEESKELITCQYIAPTWSDGLDDKGKFDYSKFKTPDSVKQHVSPDTQRQVVRRRALSPRANITHSNDWGRRLAEEFRDMESNGQSKRVLECYSKAHMWSTARARDSLA